MLIPVYVSSHMNIPYSCLFKIQYRIPDAYDLEGGVNQEKRFSVASQRYRLVISTNIFVTVALAYRVVQKCVLVLESQFST